MHRSAFTVFAVLGLTLTLQACNHHGGGPGERGDFRSGGPGGPGGPGGTGMGPPEGAQLKIFDLDGDGRLTRDELERALLIEFAKCDTDKDGILSSLEARALNDRRRGEGNNASPVFDWNADGHVDFKEFANQQLSLFDRTDLNGDGVLTEQELTRPPMGPGGHRRGARPEGSSSGGGRPDTVGQ